jgi:hypothetical protein
MPKYKSHDILNRHSSSKNTHSDIQNVGHIHPTDYNNAFTRNTEKILEITYDTLLRNCPSMASHMRYMDSNGKKTAIAIFEKQLCDTTSDFDVILQNHKRYSTLKLNAIIVQPTDDSSCGIVDPEIFMKSRTVTIHGTVVEWVDSMHVDSSGKVVPILYHVTSADRWGVIIKNLANIYPSTFSDYYMEFINKYPQTDIEVDSSDRIVYYMCIIGVCFFYAGLVLCV